MATEVHILDENELLVRLEHSAPGGSFQNIFMLALLENHEQKGDIFYLTCESL